MLLFVTVAHANVVKVFDTKNSRYISYDQLISKLPATGFISLGEFHNDTAIQNSQAQIISDHVRVTNSHSNFKVMWEFLNFTEQPQISLEFELLKEGVISTDEFITRTAGKQNLSYAPIIEVAKKSFGEVVGLNLPRSIKKQVMESGISSVDQDLIPHNHRLGSSSYLSRFKQAMGGHAPDEVIMKYFLAQSLTDSVMSYHSYENHHNLSYIIAGSFHTDFFDGTVAMLKELTSQPVTSLKVVNLDGLSEGEINNYNLADKSYGYYADFIIYSK